MLFLLVKMSIECVLWCFIIDIISLITITFLLQKMFVLKSDKYNVCTTTFSLKDRHLII